MELSYCGPKLESSLISTFELEIGCLLPSDYREFLLQTNGGIPEPSGFRFKGGGSVVGEFFPLILDHGRGFELFQELRHPEKYPMAKRLKWIAIARDFGGNRIYLSCKSGELILVDPFYSKKGILIAKSFSEFISLLEEV